MLFLPKICLQIMIHQRKMIKINHVSYVVLDEADEMLNMGFKEDIDGILSHTPDEKSTWLFSATMPRDVEKISKSYMNSKFLEMN